MLVFRYRSGWRASHSGEAARYVLSGLWKAIRPPPGLLVAVLSSGRMVGGWCRLCCSCCCGGDNGRRSGRRRKDEARAALKRLGSGGLGLGLGLGQRAKGKSKSTPKAGVRDKDNGRLAAVARSKHFWCFKVCLPHVLLLLVQYCCSGGFFRARCREAGVGVTLVQVRED